MGTTRECRLCGDKAVCHHFIKLYGLPEGSYCLGCCTWTHQWDGPEDAREPAMQEILEDA
jgi:hypothetical protein